MTTDLRTQLTALALAVGEASENLVIAGEGNISGLIREGALLVSASGARLGTADQGTWVEVRTAELLEASHRDMSDADWLGVLLRSRADPNAARPTVEVGLHAVLAHTMSARFIVHTHPMHLLSILCSGYGVEYSQKRLFPDHVVMLGVADCLVPYINPGRELADAVASAVVEHRHLHGEDPKVVLAENHGAFVLGSTAQESLDRSRMVNKTARIFMDAVMGGRKVVGLPPSEVARIAGREDEEYRRRILA